MRARMTGQDNYDSKDNDCKDDGNDGKDDSNDGRNVNSGGGGGGEIGGEVSGEVGGMDGGKVPCTKLTLITISRMTKAKNFALVN